jgi:hypothetical protein
MAETENQKEIAVPIPWIKYFKGNMAKAAFLSMVWSLQIAESREGLTNIDGSFAIFPEILLTELCLSKRSYFRYSQELKKEGIIKTVNHGGFNFTLINFAHPVFDLVREVAKSIEGINEQNYKDFSTNFSIEIQSGAKLAQPFFVYDPMRFFGPKLRKNSNLALHIYNTSYYILVKYFVFNQVMARRKNSRLKNQRHKLVYLALQNQFKNDLRPQRLNPRRSVKNVLTDRKVLSVIAYWEKTLKLPSHRKESSSYLLACKHISKALKNHGYENIKQAMNIYKELFDSRPDLKYRKYIGYHVHVSEFFGFTPNTKNLLMESGHLKGVDSWFDECMQGRDHAFNVFHGIPKDVNPAATLCIKQGYLEIFPSMSKAVYNNLEEKQFRMMTRKFADLLKTNRDRWCLDSSSRPAIQKVIRLFFRYLNTKTLKRTNPGFLLADWLHKDFESWLYENGHLENRR